MWQEIDDLEADMHYADVRDATMEEAPVHAKFRAAIRFLRAGISHLVTQHFSQSNSNSQQINQQAVYCFYTMKAQAKKIGIE